MDALMPALACAAVLLLPGMAVLPWLPGDHDDIWEFLAEAVGVSIAVSALAALGFYLLKIPPGGWGMGILGGAAIVSLVAAGLAGRLRSFTQTPWWLWLVGILTAGALLALRIYQVRDLAFPNWVDSVHHTFIVRSILETGGIPDTLKLDAPAQFSYHYGFHILAAEMAALAQVPADRAVLWFGHALFLSSSLVIYRLGRGLGFDRAAAWIAALLPGFVLHMPAYYVSWGRYTLLTGMVVLPVTICAALELAEVPFPRRGEPWSRGIKLTLLVAGLALTHYLALLLLAFFLAVLGLGKLIQAARARQLDRLPWFAAVACVSGLGLALPWLIPMLSQNSSLATLGEARTNINLQDFKAFVDMLRPEQSLAIMALAGICVFPAFFQPGIRLVAGWGLLTAFFAMPFSPRLGPFRTDHFAIVLFLPASLLLGWGLSGGARGIKAVLSRVVRLDHPAWRRAPAWTAAAALVLAVGLLLGWGWMKTRTIINPATVIADMADRRALEWVAQNTPPTARFYINSTRWLGEIYRGVDGGYWLLPFTGRSSLVPPIVYVWQPEENWRRINDWAGRSAEIKGCTPAFWDLARDAGFNYLYLREGRGSLQPSNLADCPRLERIYNQDGIGIYRLK